MMILKCNIPHFNVADRGCLRHFAAKYDRITMQQGLSSVLGLPMHTATAWESDVGMHDSEFLFCCLVDSVNA